MAYGAALVAGVLLAGCGTPAEDVGGAEPAPSTVLPAAGSAPAAEPGELLPDPADIGDSWQVVAEAPPAAAGCSRAGSRLPVPETAERRVLSDGAVFAEVAAWSTTDADAAAVADAVRSGAYDPPQAPCTLTPRVVDFAMGPTEEPGVVLEDDRAAEPLVRVEHVDAAEQVAATEFALAVQRGPVVAVAVLHGGGPFTQHDAAFAVHRAVIEGACAEPARPGCEGPEGVGRGLLAPAALGLDWSVGRPDLPSAEDSSLFCNGVGGYGWSGAIEHASRAFRGPDGSTAFQGVLGGVDEQLSGDLREAAADRGAHTSRGCREEPERVEEMLVDEIDAAAGTWARAMRVTETLASGESATALVAGVARGPAVGMLTVRDDGSVDVDAVLAAVRTGVCAVPTATGC